MKFGSVPVQDALGGIVAHAIKHGDFVLKKGTLIDQAALARLKSSGVATVVIARFEPGDVSEDEAAQQLALAVAGPQVRLDPPFTGRTNLFAETAGVLRIDVPRIDAANDIDDAITIATLPALKRVALGEMIGTVKIIPFAVNGAKLERAIQGARGAISIAPFRRKRIAVISTELPGLKRSVIDKTLHVLNERLQHAGASESAIIGHEIIPHVAHALTIALQEAAARADIVIVFGASAITDHRDVIPSAIEAAGGRVDHFGMPVDPGNLLLIGRIGGTSVIGAPGCARSPKENGFDWVLERFLADIAVTKADIRKMGVGGLLMEIISRPQPRAPELAPVTPEVAIMVLAAGTSSRMGSNKLTESWNGKPILRHVVEAALSSKRKSRVALITGHQADRAETMLSGLPLSMHHNEAFASGMASSVKVAISEVPKTASAAIIMLGDMPKITGAMLDRLILAFGEHPSAKAVVPTVAGQRGNPVLLARSGFAEVARLSGDQGARKLLEAWATETNGEGVVEVALDDDALLFDVDTKEALAALRG